MSEQLNSVKIEDVLSSIRRLVSEEHRPKTRPLRGMVAEAVLTDKLILTPALRVEEAADDPVSDGVPAAPEDAAAAVVVDLAARLGAVAEPEAGSDDILTDEGAVAEAALAAEPEVAEIAEGERVHVEAEAGVIEDADVVAEVVAGAVVFDGGEAEDLPVAANLPVEPVQAARMTDAQPAAAEDAGAVSVPEDTVAEAVPFVHRVRGGGEPAAAAAEDPPAAEQASGGIAPEDEPEAESIDEETLREIVRDVLREELQGMFGERITRNVRKLVRSEIAKAMAVKGIE